MSRNLNKDHKYKATPVKQRKPKTQHQNRDYNEASLLNLAKSNTKPNDQKRRKYYTPAFI